MEGGKTGGNGDKTRFGWLGTGDTGSEPLRICGDSDARLELLWARGWLDRIELRWTDMGMAEAGDVEAAGVGRACLGRLSAGGDEGKLASRVKSGRTSAWAT